MEKTGSTLRYDGMMIDAHNHPDWYGYTYEKFIANMDANGIGKTWLLSWECPEDEYDPQYIPVVPERGPHGPIPFSICRTYGERNPERFILGFAPDLRRADAIDMLRAAVDLYGVRVCGEVKLRMMYDSPDAMRVFRYCGERGLPVVLHFDDPHPTGQRYPRTDWWYGGDMHTLERMLEGCPETVFLGHAPGFWARIADGYIMEHGAYPKGPIDRPGPVIDLLERFPNLYCDLSGGSGHNALSRDPAFAAAFLTRFQDRMLFARDAFDNVQQECIDALGLSRTIRDKVYYKNAQALLGEEV